MGGLEIGLFHNTGEALNWTEPLPPFTFLHFTYSPVHAGLS